MKAAFVGKYKLELFKLKLPSGDYDGPPLTLVYNRKKTEVFHIVTTTEHHQVVENMYAQKWLKTTVECYIAGYVDDNGVFIMRPDLTTAWDQKQNW